MRKSVVVGVALIVVSGCGGGKAANPEPDRSAGEKVILAWTEAVRDGDYEKAKGLFATPSTIFNGGPKVTLETTDDIDAFNRSLPCGAVLEATQVQANEHLLATFRLVKASGGRTCRGSIGAKARVSFLIDADGHIKEWFRVSTEPPPGSQEA
jgi:hypothetical protein